MESSRQERKLPPAIKAYHAVNGLRPLKVTLGLVEAALVMSIEGTNRATASEILNRATDEFSVTCTAAVTGQIFSQLKIATATTHGKPRLVLDSTQLKVIKDQITKKITELSEELAEVLGEYKGIDDHIKNMEQQLKEAANHYVREKELSQHILEMQNKPSRLSYLEQEYARLRKEDEKADSLRKECDELARKVKTLPILEGRKVALNNSIRRYQDEEGQVKAAEIRLGEDLVDLKMRSGWVTFLDLDRNIQRQKAELNQLAIQINERRTFLQKILGTNKVK